MIDEINLILLVILPFLLGLMITAYLVAKGQLHWEPDWMELRSKSEINRVKEFLREIREEEREVESEEEAWK